MVLLSVICTGIAVGLFCLYFLQRRQRLNQQHELKTRFFGNTARPQPSVLTKLTSKRAAQRSAHRYEAELPRMLDILAMGMHAGLSFDAAFGIYVERFDSELALLCRERFDLWQRGLISRREGLEQLASKVDMPLFDRFCRMALRSIKHGVPLAPLIKEYSQQARTEYRNKQKEKVLKAPVKMLLPTGVLILPAMMMLVLGPIILDVTGRMV